MAMPQGSFLEKGAKRPSHTKNTIKFDRIPFDPCNWIKRFDLSLSTRKIRPIYSHPIELIELIKNSGRFRIPKQLLHNLLNFFSSVMCIIMLEGEDTHPWSATKVGDPIPANIPVDQ